MDNYRWTFHFQIFLDGSLIETFEYGKDCPTAQEVWERADKLALERGLSPPTSITKQVIVNVDIPRDFPNIS